MKLVNTSNNKFVDADPKTLTAGTPIPASTMNALQDEIANVVTGYGLTIDENNDAQMKQALDKHFAPINSPSLTGIPLTTNPDGNTDNQIATVAYVKQYGTETSLGYQAVQQGGGTSMGTNKIYMGADSTDNQQVRVQIDSNAVGKLVLQEEDSSTYGVSKIGFNKSGNTLAFYDTGNKEWHYCYTFDQIDGKSFISSLPSGNNQKISNIIWNTSSSLPALYYGTSNTVDYLATSDWSNNTFQFKGDYATNTALQSEASSFRAELNRCVKNTNGGIGGEQAGTSLVYQTSAGHAFFSYNNNTSGGSLAWYSDVVAEASARTNAVNNLQNQINGKQQAGNYVPTSTYQNDFATGDSRIINLAYGHRIQVFQAYVGNGTNSGSWITFPQAFSGTPVFYQANSNGNDDGVTDTDYWCYGANSTGMYVRPRNHQGSANIIVIGPR